MARTKQTARKSTGGRKPRRTLLDALNDSSPDPSHQTTRMPDTEDVDADGDLVLLIGSEARRTRVSRVAMRLASPLWKRMLTGSFAETTEEEVKFPDDDEKSLRILLLLAHLQYKRIPTCLTLQEIATVAQVADKYEMASMAEDRMWKWIDKIDRGIKVRAWEFDYSEDPTKIMDDGYAFMWIGWALKNSYMFYDGLYYVMWRVAPANLVKDAGLPPGCREFIIHWCTQKLGDVLDALYDPLAAEDELINPQCAHAAHMSKKHVERCAILRRGVAANLLLSLSLPLTPETMPDVLTLQKSARDIRSVSDNTRAAVDTEIGDCDHGDCLASLWAINDVLEAASQSRYLEMRNEFSKFFMKTYEKSVVPNP